MGGREGRSRARGYGGPAGAAALGLALLGLALYLVPAAAALAWLAVGASAAWWGLSREPRGPRALSSFVRDARRHPRPALTASPPPAKSPVNGSLCEPRSPLGGPDPAELLLMGSYLGKPGPPEPALRQDPRERPGRRPPARSPPPASAVQRVHHVYPALPHPAFATLPEAAPPRLWAFVQSVCYNTPKTISHSASPVFLAWGTSNRLLEWWP